MIRSEEEERAFREYARAQFLEDAADSLLLLNRQEVEHLTLGQYIDTLLEMERVPRLTFSLLGEGEEDDNPYYSRGGEIMPLDPYLREYSLSFDEELFDGLGDYD